MVPTRGMILWRTSAALLCVVELTGCVSASKYRMARDDAPPAELLNVPFPAAPVQVTLTALISYGGPGSWKREALWDEYILALRNPGAEPITIVAAELTDHIGGAHFAGENPWRLEDASKALLKEYDRLRVQFVNAARPAVLTVGGVAVGAAALAAATSTGGVVVTAMQGPIAMVSVPSYLIGRAVANYDDRLDIEAAFQVRRVPLPLTLAPGQTRIGAFFFPMVANPRALTVRWRQGDFLGASVLPLEFLAGLHAAAPPQAAAK